MKKALFLFLALALALALAGCGHTHEWVEATCTEPKTCAEDGATEGEPLGHDWKAATCTAPKTCARCGETEGEPLGHDWKEADCTTPKTCARCGETEGEPLGHTLTEANYQDPAVCTVCGETVGEPLTPDFVTYGIKTDMEVGEHYAYETICYDDPSFKTVADLVLLDYNIFESDDTHEAKDGYEWRVATFQIIFSDENAQYYGYQYGYAREDYYDIRLNDDSVVYDDDGNGTFTVNYHGEDMECLYYQEILMSGWQDQTTANNTFSVNYQVPVGYDGCVFGMFDYSYSYLEGGYIFDIYDPDAFILFRFD